MSMGSIIAGVLLELHPFISGPGKLLFLTMATDATDLPFASQSHFHLVNMASRESKQRNCNFDDSCEMYGFPHSVTEVGHTGLIRTKVLYHRGYQIVYP